MSNLRLMLTATVGLLVGAALIGAIIILGSPRVTEPPFVAAAPLPPLPVIAPVEASAIDVAAVPEPGVAVLASTAWLAGVAKNTGIPVRALAAYAGAAIQVGIQNPTCGLGWNTLAAIGSIESHHGTIFGGTLAANGDATPAIYGIALDGVDAASIPDSDGGKLDGDPLHDRAMGPMQLIPQTWRSWHVDGNADGTQNPQNIDDATVAAAHYLCRAGKNLTTADGWDTAILAYNGSSEYRDDVLRAAVQYAADAK
jgi:membrane-bound lytic murein transglycosylase B